jgi:cell division control protein 6
MSINFLEEQYYSRNLFLHEEKFDVTYLPDILLHRDAELVILSKIFISLLENPFSVSQKVLITGDIGLGKTAISQYLGRMLLNSAQKRQLNIKYIHINCRREKTSYKVLHQILTDLNCNIPNRGFSPQDLASTLHQYLKQNNIYVVIALDEINFLENNKFDLIYCLTRFNDADFNSPHYFSLISIVKDIGLIRNLDDSTISTLQGTTLNLAKYTTKQIYEILAKRVEIGIKPGVISEEILNLIANIISDEGDIRKGLNIIRNAVRIAENNDQSYVSKENIYQSMKYLIPSIYDDGLDTLNLHQFLLMDGILDTLMKKGEKILQLNELKNAYNEKCNMVNENPRANTQIWEYLQFLKNQNLIDISINTKNQRGRSSVISINSNIPELELRKKIKYKINQQIKRN